MQTVTVKFDLPEDREEMEAYLRGPLYGIALGDITDYLRRLYKYDSDRVGGLTSMELLEEIRDHISTLLPPDL